MKQMELSVFEALFRQAVIDDYNEEIDSIPPRERLLEIITISTDFELRMKRLLTRDKRKELLRKAVYYGKRAAAVVLIISNIVFGILLCYPEVRAAVHKTIVEWYDKFTSFVFQSESSDTDEPKEWEPRYLPKGYDKDSVTRLGRTTNMEYVDAQGNIIVLSYRPTDNNTTISVDNENHRIEIQTIRGHEAHIAEATNPEFDNGVIWSMEGYTFYLWSKLPVTELIQIAQSIN